MPVEKNGRERQKFRSVPIRSELETRRAFVEALGRTEGAPDVANRLKISLSTYYKWKTRWVEYGMDWVDGIPITRAKRLPGETVKRTRERVVTLSLENPTWGAAKLANFLKEHLGLQCSAGTVHSILKEVSLSSRQERALALYKRHLETGDLTSTQRQVLIAINPFAAWSRKQVTTAGAMLIQDLVPIAHTSPLGSCALMVIVDAFDQRAFAKFSNTPSDSPERDFLEEVVGWYRGREIQVKQVVTNNGYQYSGSFYGRLYENSLENHGIAHRFDTDSTCGLRLNPLVTDVWNTLKQYLFNEMREACLNTKNSRGSLNPLIQKFLDREFGDG